MGLCSEKVTSSTSWYTPQQLLCAAVNLAEHKAVQDTKLYLHSSQVLSCDERLSLAATRIIPFGPGHAYGSLYSLFHVLAAWMSFEVAFI